MFNIWKSYISFILNNIICNDVYIFFLYIKYSISKNWCKTKAIFVNISEIIVLGFKTFFKEILGILCVFEYRVDIYFEKYLK